MNAKKKHTTEAENKNVKEKKINVSNLWTNLPIWCTWDSGPRILDMNKICQEMMFIIFLNCFK
jgi:hypothetical protein